MKILIHSTEFPPGPGGIGTHAHEVARHLAGMGWGVTVVSPQDYVGASEIEQFNQAQPFPVHRLLPKAGPPIEAIHRYRLIRRIARAERPDIIMATGERAAWIVAAFSRRSGIPWVAVGHGTEFGLRRNWEHRLMQWAYARADAVICVSEFTKDLMRRHDIHPKRCLVIPNGADAGRFQVVENVTREGIVPGLDLSSSSLLLTVGHVSERKGQDIVIRAMPAILEAVPNTHYLIAGLPTRQAELSELARSLGVERHVHFLGRRDNATIVKLMNLCDVYVMTSRNTADGDVEGFGIAVVEAALCGKPSVVTANTGLSEAIIAGETGLAVPENDHRRTTEAVVSLLGDRKLLRRMGEAAKLRALREQTWQQRVALYDQLFRSIAEAPATGRPQPVSA